MIDAKKLKARMVLEDVTINEVADLLNVTPKTIYNRLNSKRKFSSDEISKLIKRLKINDANEVIEIFFPDFVTCEATLERS